MFIMLKWEELDVSECTYYIQVVRVGCLQLCLLHSVGKHWGSGNVFVYTKVTRVGGLGMCLLHSGGKRLKPGSVFIRLRYEELDV